MTYAQEELQARLTQAAAMTASCKVEMYIKRDIVQVSASLWCAVIGDYVVGHGATVWDAVQRAHELKAEAEAR